MLVKLAALVKDPNTELATICALVRNDGPLVADIIRISNSPYYAPATFHSNLISAVTQIGLQEVVRVVNLSLSRQLFARDLTSYGITASDYWSAAAAAALMMEGLAKHCGLDPDDAYTVGLLHALGRVLINRVIEQMGYTIFWDGHQPIEAWERDSMGFDFAETGAMLLEHWRFPTATCEVIRWQLIPEKVTEQVSLLGSLQFTRRLLALTGLDFQKPDWCLPERDPFVQAMELSQETASKLVAGCRDDFHDILQSMDLR
jgi:HD-like signal output (HDOD) protein